MIFGIGKTDKQIQLDTQEILSLFSPVEGDINFYYGKTRNGKTYGATADILALLERGEIVFANWHINFEDYDERKSFIRVFFKLVFGRKLFFKYKKENLHYFSPAETSADLVRMLNKLVNVHIFIDEGQWVLNSHSRNPDPEAQRLILTNGHYCRSLSMISQRAGNVMKDYRSQVMFWFKFKKVISWPVLIFSKTIIEDMKDDMPDEESEENKTQVYFAKKRIFNAYNTHAMRGADAIEHMSIFETYEIGWTGKLKLLLLFFVPKRIKAASSAYAERRLERIAEKKIVASLEWRAREDRRIAKRQSRIRKQEVIHYVPVEGPVELSEPVKVTSNRIPTI